MKRSELKAIIKECLVEILAEGMGGNLKKQVNEAIHEAQVRPTPAPAQRQVRRQQPNPMQEHIKHLAGGNNVLADIMAHTAQETLPLQASVPDPEKAMTDFGMSMMGGQAFYPEVGPDPMFESSPMPSHLPGMGPSTPVQGDAMNAWERAAFGPRRSSLSLAPPPPPPTLPKLSDAQLNSKAIKAV